MPEYKRADGQVTLRLPANIEVTTVEDTTPRRRMRGGGQTDGDDSLAAVVEALSESELESVFHFSLDASGPASPQRRRRGTRTSGEDVEPAQIDVEVESGEHAVVLFEQDGVMSWRFPNSEVKPPPKKRAVRGDGSREIERSRVLRFSLDELEPAGGPARKRRGDGHQRRGILKDLVSGRVKAWVLKFVARRALGVLERRLEKNVEPGIVVLEGVETSSWKKLDSLEGQFRPPRDRSARVLLLVHGTFSSTLGSYGALAVSDEGRDFLEGAIDAYDLVLGFDHYSLSETPAENASEIMRALLSVDWPQPPTVDAIAYSRGGLVYRYLTEYILPCEKPEWTRGFSRAVFVGCTNGGTELANPHNWERLVDLYTNLVVWGARSLGAATQTLLPAEIFAETIKGIATFVKYLADEAVTNKAIPGLAAMEPDGDFVREINTEQPGQPTSLGSRYFAVLSEFTAEEGEGALPERVKRYLIDFGADQLFEMSNDLVVHTESMEHVDPQTGGFIKDSLDFGRNPHVYHTVYFQQPQVAQMIMRWLDLDQRPVPVVSIPSNTSRSSVIARDWRNIDAGMLCEDAGKLLWRHPASYVVIGRRVDGHTLHYGMRYEPFMEAMERAREVPVEDGLGLHEHDSEEMPVDEVIRRDSSGDVFQPSREVDGFRVVAMDDSGPVGVVRHRNDPLASPQMPMEVVSSPSRRSGGAAKKKRPAKKKRVKRGKRAKRGGGGSGSGSVEETPASESAKEDKALCHFHAETSEQAKVGELSAVDVYLSREEILRGVGDAAAGGSAEVDTGRNLTIELKARKNCVIEGDSRIDVPVPDSGAVTPLFFDMRPTDAGRGEIWVIVRQGPVPAAMLKLYPQFVEGDPGPTKRLRAEAVVNEAEPEEKTLVQLRIFDRQNGDRHTLEFVLSSPDLDLEKKYESEPFKTEHSVYVEALYRKIEDFWARDSGEYDRFLERLRATGVTMFTELFPKELQRVMWEKRDELQNIQVFSEEPFIPWEVVHLKDPDGSLTRGGESEFLAEKGLVRWLWLDGDNGSPARKLANFDSNCYSVVPEYPPGSDRQLDGAQEELDLMKDTVGTRSLPADSGEVIDLLATKGGFELLHFACHGEAESGAIWDAGLLMTGKMRSGKYVKDLMTPDQVTSFANFHSEEGRRPVVFLNACQTGRTGPQLTGLGGFAKAFLEKGAGAFIGSLWSVGDTAALHFAEKFYQTILMKDKSFAEAVVKARKYAKDKEDVTWLSYVAYGHPYAQLDR